MICLRTLIAQATTSLAAIFTYLAHAYDVLGFGINPFISLPLACFFMAVPHIFNAVFTEE